jgi:hypothetical protein
MGLSGVLGCTSRPHERSDLSHRRKRLGDRLDLLLAESLRVAHTSGALRTRDLARAMPTPSSSTATIDKCASCAPGWVG